MMIYKKLSPSDLPLLIDLVKLYEDVFEMQELTLPPTAYLQTLLEKNSPFFFVALEDNQVIGGLTAHILPSVYSASAEIYIYDLAVKTTMQRKGIGRGLIAALKEDCKASGYQEIFVQADLEDQHALDFYKATGGSAENVVHFSYKL